MMSLAKTIRPWRSEDFKVSARSKKASPSFLTAGLILGSLGTARHKFSARCQAAEDLVW